MEIMECRKNSFPDISNADFRTLSENSEESDGFEAYQQRFGEEEIWNKENKIVKRKSIVETVNLQNMSLYNLKVTQRKLLMDIAKVSSKKPRHLDAHSYRK
mgnify:CR=1 FL=1